MVYRLNCFLCLFYRYDFKLHQIYSITQDNERNFILAGKMLSSEKFQLRQLSSDVQDRNEVVASDIESTSDMEASPAYSSSNLSMEGNERSAQAVLNDDVNDEDGGYEVDAECFDDNSEYEYIDEEEGYDRIEDVDEVGDIVVLKCAAHTLALAVGDTITDLQAKRVSKKFRTLAKFLRNLTQIAILKRKKLTLPKMDVKVRWNSSYDLIHSLMKLRSHCEDENIKILTASDWVFGQKFLKVFLPTEICTKQLQNEQITLADFFKKWTNLSLRVQKISKTEPMATKLYRNLIKREVILFTDNNAIQAALYLDPRFRHIFEKMKPNYFSVSKAQKHLFQLFKNLNEVQVSLPITNVFPTLTIYSDTVVSFVLNG